MLKDIFSKKYFWIGQGPIDKIKRAARLSTKDSTTHSNLLAFAAQ